MTLTALTHVKHTTGAPAANTVAGWLDAIYDQLNGAMTHWTVSRYQNGGATECVYFTPKAGPALTKGVRIMLAGADSGALTPTMGLNSTFANSKLYMGLVINAGDFNAWDNASPFTSHDEYSGLLPVGACASISANFFTVLESAETIFVRPDRTLGDVGGGLAGAIIDPESTNTLNASSTQDERVYGVLTAGDSTAWTSVGSFGNTNQPGYHGTSATAPKFVILNAAGDWVAAAGIGGSQTHTFDTVQADGSPWLLPLFACLNASPNKMLGRLREFYMGPKVQKGVDVYSSAPAKTAHVMGADPATGYAAIAFKAA